MNLKEKLKLIKRNTEELINEKELNVLLKKNNYSAYIGFAPTGQMHLGHLIPLIKIADFLKAGFKFKFLIADIHAFLDNKKTPWNALDARSKYYEEIIKSVFKSIGANISKVEFEKGSNFQLKKEYVLDLLHLSGEITLKRSKRASSEVVRFKEDPKLGGFIYPIMQILDPIYLKADVCFSGLDQRGIYMLGREVLPKFKFRTLTCIFTPLLPGLNGEKMSASDAKGKINLLDTKKEIFSKINKAYCPTGELKNNGVVAFVKHVVFPLRGKLAIKRPIKYGGNLEFDSYEKFETAFVKRKIHPADLKEQLGKEINSILKPVRVSMKGKYKIIEKAYPK